MLIKKRKFAAIMKPHLAEVHEEDLKPIGPNDLLIKLEICNICTSDYQQWKGLRNHMGFPMAAGHEWCGRIIDKGQNVADDFKIGTRVGYAFAGCGACDDCRQGLNGNCDESIRNYTRVENGFIGDRGFCNYKVIDQRSAFILPSDIPPEEAAFLEPLSTVVRCMRKASVKPTDTVVIIGNGTMGLLNAQVANAYGAKVIITGRNEKKLERTRRMGIADVIDITECNPVERVYELTNNRGADIVIPTAGTTQAYEQAYKMLKSNYGKLVLFAAGYPAPELSINPNEIHYRRIDILGTEGSNEDDYYEAAKLLSQHKVWTGCALEGKTFPLKEIQKAYEAASEIGAYRVSVSLQEI